MTFSDGLAVAAIALSLSTIFFGVLFYRWQTEQGARISDTINKFAKEMHGVLGEIKGLTTGTREELQEQFKVVLQAAIGQERASMAEDVVKRLEGVEQHVAGVEERSQATGDDELKTIVVELKRDLSSLRQFGDREGRSWLHFGWSKWDFLVIHPHAIGSGERVTIWRPTRLSDLPVGSYMCEVRMPDGRSLSKLWPDSQPQLVFPDDFRGGSTDLEGEYAVTAYYTPTLVALGMAELTIPVNWGSFYVGTGGPE